MNFATPVNRSRFRSAKYILSLSLASGLIFLAAAPLVHASGSAPAVKVGLSADVPAAVDGSVRQAGSLTASAGQTANAVQTAGTVQTSAGVQATATGGAAGTSNTGAGLTAGTAVDAAADTGTASSPNAARTWNQDGQGSRKQAPALLPDNLFYFLKTLLERIQLGLTFNDADKAKLLANFAGERIAEAQALEAKGKVNLAGQTLQAAAEQQAQSADLAAKAAGRTRVQTAGAGQAQAAGSAQSKQAAAANSTKEQQQLQIVKLELSRNVAALTQALSHVKNPKAKASIQANINKAVALLDLKTSGKLPAGPYGYGVQAKALASMQDGVQTNSQSRIQTNGLTAASAAAAQSDGNNGKTGGADSDTYKDHTSRTAPNRQAASRAKGQSLRHSVRDESGASTDEAHPGKSEDKPEGRGGGLLVMKQQAGVTLNSHKDDGYEQAEGGKD